MPREVVTPMRDLPFWPAMEDLAQALIYDAKQLGDFRPRPPRLAQVTSPPGPSPDAGIAALDGR
jgi:hypothetical protein